ncbi:hypothetical protein [Streptomyces griseoaurantiacus]|uniref:hypothetical protein n=1 Tax=Streptomyces griseoaurantiacus TaxID=68213 RepID=UPI0030E25098
MMSNNEVPRQGGPVDDFEELEIPPASARWDDPPSALSEDDLMRMAPGSIDDGLLADIADELWAPVELGETPEADAERLKSITDGGAQLRERWAETAALEEAYTAPPAFPTQVRMRKARRERTLQRHERIMREKQRHRRVQRICMAFITAAGATLAFALTSDSGFAVSVMTNIVIVVAVFAEGIARLGAVRSRTSWLQASLRKLQRLGAVMKKPE